MILWHTICHITPHILTDHIICHIIHYTVSRHILYHIEPYIISYITYHIILYDITPYIISYITPHTVPCHMTQCMTYHIISHHMSYHLISYHARYHHLSSFVLLPSPVASSKTIETATRARCEECDAATGRGTQPFSSTVVAAYSRGWQVSTDTGYIENQTKGDYYVVAHLEDITTTPG